MPHDDDDPSVIIKRCNGHVFIWHFYEEQAPYAFTRIRRQYWEQRPGFEELTFEAACSAMSDACMAYRSHTDKKQSRLTEGSGR